VFYRNMERQSGVGRERQAGREAEVESTVGREVER
jgi:hypothetical protein